MKQQIRRFLLLLSVLGIMFGLLTGCDSSNGDNSPKGATYRIEFINVTADQPLSPAAFILHGQGYSAWQISQASGSGLEHLAEGGDPAMLLQEAKAIGATREVQAGTAAVLPGTAEIINMTGTITDARLTLASMLVNINDDFTGIDNADLTGLPIGTSRSWELVPFDAGTESNVETATTIPGPAGGGEGYNAVRDDRKFVAIHPGVVSSDDGLTDSALCAAHRFQSPVARLVVTRID